MTIEQMDAIIALARAGRDRAAQREHPALTMLDFADIITIATDIKRIMDNAKERP